jgi:hypothetical protein
MPPFSPAQCEVKFPAFQIAPQTGALIDADVESQPGARAGKTRQQFCQAIGRKILGDAEAHRAFLARSRQHVAGFLRERQ